MKLFNNVTFDFISDMDVNFNINSVLYYPPYAATIHIKSLLINRNSDIGKDIERNLRKACQLSEDDNIKAAVFGLGTGYHLPSIYIYIEIGMGYIYIGNDIIENDSKKGIKYL